MNLRSGCLSATLLSVLISWHSSASYGALIFIPDVEVVVGTPFVDIPVMVVGGEPVSDMFLVIQVGDGGTVTGKPPVPRITAFDLSGSIWQDAPGGFTTSSAFPPPDEIPDLSLNLDATGETVAADGVLTRFTIDSSMLSLGESVTLSLTSDFGDRTDLRGPSGPLNADLVGGSLTASAVPEPNPLLLLFFSVAAMAFVAWRQSRPRMPSSPES